MSYFFQIKNCVNTLALSYFKTTLKTALMTVFLAVIGCGSQDKKKDPSQEEKTDPSKDTEQEYYSGNNTSTPDESDTYLERYQLGGPNFNKQMTGRGWVCEIVLVNSLKMNWDFLFSIGRMTGTAPVKHSPEFRITFKRDSKESPWNYDAPAIDVSSFGDFELAVKIKDDVVKLIDQGYRAIIDTYDCSLHKPDNLRDRF